MTKIKYVLFDLDGTLLYTLEDLRDSINYVLAKYGYPARTMEQVTAAVGNGLGKLTERCLPMGADTPHFTEIVSDFKSYYAAHSDIKTRPYDGIIPMLADLKTAGVRMACVTNKPQNAADILYKKHFADYLDFMQGENPPMPRKPDAAPVYAVMERLGATKDECVYVGDSEVDFQTAQNSGVRCILCSWGFRGRALCESLKPDFIADTPDDVVRAVCGGGL